MSLLFDKTHVLKITVSIDVPDQEKAAAFYCNSFDCHETRREGACLIVTIGQVERIDWRSPHFTLTLRLARNGQADQVWTVELDSSGQLAESAFGERVVHVHDWVKVLLYPSQSTLCADACNG